MIVEVVGDKLETSIYHKPQALHLYLPPNSCHAPGVVYGLISGMALRIHSLCSREQDIEKELVFFFCCLVDRGHQANVLVPLFSNAITKTRSWQKESIPPCALPPSEPFLSSDPRFVAPSWFGSRPQDPSQSH